MSNKSYPGCLKTIGLDTLEIRRTRLDLIKMCKLTNGLIDMNSSSIINFRKSSRPRNRDYSKRLLIDK